MADLSPTLTCLKPSTLSSPTLMATAGETIAAGDLLYLDGETLKWMVADRSSPTKLEVGAVALQSAILDGVFMVLMPGGVFNPSATTVEGEVYVLSLLGKIALHSDLVTGNAFVFVGYGYGTASIKFMPSNTGLTMG